MHAAEYFQHLFQVRCGKLRAVPAQASFVCTWQLQEEKEEWTS